MKKWEESLPGKPLPRSPLRWILPVILMFTASVAFAYWWNQQQPPHLISLKPDPGSGILSPFIEVEALFSHPMDPKSVENGVVFQVEQGGKWSREMPVAERGKFTWTSHNRRVIFSLHPDNYPEVGTVIRLKARNLRAKNGKILQPPVQVLQFKVVPFDQSDSWKLRSLYDLFRAWSNEMK